MKELLKQYSSYNIWATQRIVEIILPLPEDIKHAEVPSSFNSLYKTLLHMWDAESIWWQRMKLTEKVIRPSENFSGTFSEVSTSLYNQSKLWEEWITNASELSIEHVFQYYTTKKELIKLPVYQMLLHVFNHGTYHRGQLVTMLRQLGIESLKSTDFSVWCVKK